MIRELVTVLAFHAKGLREAENGMQRLQGLARGLVGALAGLGAAFSVKALAEAGDEMTRAMGRIDASLVGVGGSAQDVYEKIYNISRVTGVAVEAGVSGFSRMQSAVAEMGGTPEQVLSIVKGLQQAGAVAGATGEDIAEATRQMGQALSSPTLQWEEIGIIADRMPNLVRAMRDEMGISAANFKKMVSDGKVLSKDAFPALVRASGKFGAQFERLPATMGRTVGALRVTWTRFLADLDTNLGLSQYIARNLDRISTWMERLRGYLPNVGALTRELGGMDAIVRVLGYSLGVAAAGFAVLNRAMFGTLLRLAAIPAAILAVAIGLDDLAGWMEGKDSLIGRSGLGEFEPLLERTKEALGPFAGALSLIRDAFSSTAGLLPKTLAEFKQLAEWGQSGAALLREHWGTIGPLFAALFRDVTPSLSGLSRDFTLLRDFLVAAPGLIENAWNGLIGFFTRIFEGIATTVEERWARIKKVVEEIKGAVSGGFTNPGDKGAPAPTHDPLGNVIPDSLSGLLPLLQMPTPASLGQQYASRMGQSVMNANVNAPVTNNNNVTVNATGTNGAEIAAAAQSGVSRAMPTGDSFARSLLMAMPRVEAAAA